MDAAIMDAAIPDASEPYDPNWTDHDARVDLVPDAEPPAKQHVWADWTEFKTGAQGSASARFNIAAVDGGIALSYTGDLHNAQIDGGLPYWTPGTAYTSVAVPNPPDSNDNLQLAGGLGSVHTLTFSLPAKDPVLAILSLGSRATTTVLRFDNAFELLSYGPGYYQNAQELKHLPDNKLAGRESNGAIRFKGTFTTIRWTAEISEPWYGLTVGLPTPQ
ncbi:MAG: hypothetical protein ABW352_20560 [Polyangiales bacterium]